MNPIAKALCYSFGLSFFGIALLLAFLASQAHYSGYLTVTLPLGTETSQVQITEALPLAVQTPLPGRKPKAP